LFAGAVLFYTEDTISNETSENNTPTEQFYIPIINFENYIWRVIWWY